MRWIDFPDERLAVCGLPWFDETKPEVWRLPPRMKDVVRPEVWNLAQHPSGGRIRFSTDASSLAIRLYYPDLTRHHNIHKIGQFGLDLYVDGQYWTTVFPAEQQEVEGTFFADLPGRLRNVCIYLPLYGAVRVKAVGVNDEAALWEPGPFAVPKPAIFYGGSICQGACASRSGRSYQAILSRDMLLDYVNLGLAGHGKGDAELAEAMAEIDAACYVVDFARNCGSPEAMRSVYGPFLQILRDRRDSTPIICVTPACISFDQFDEERKKQEEAMRQVVRDAVAERIGDGDAHVGLVEGPRLIGPEDVDGLADGLHPNDLGFQRMAEGIGYAILEALKASP